MTTTRYFNPIVRLGVGDRCYWDACGGHVAVIVESTGHGPEGNSVVVRVTTNRHKVYRRNQRHVIPRSWLVVNGKQLRASVGNPSLAVAASYCGGPSKIVVTSKDKA